MTERLPLFPLGTVLFPGLQLPLHIFEERYQALVRDLIALPEGIPRRFGVVTLREGREVGADGALALYGVGCTAEIESIEPYADGRYDLVTTGLLRFEVRSLDSVSEPYLVADIEFLDEPDGALEDIAVLVSDAFDDYRDRLGAGGPAAAALPDDPLVLSYLVAAATVLELTDKQRLLAAPDTSSRLRAELDFLRREVALLDVLPSLPAVDLVRVPYSLS